MHMLANIERDDLETIFDEAEIPSVNWMDINIIIVDFSC